ncbi:uncharacterized protein [Nicotiana tomentosiformis]|uniref:uncharacterized protein n=1 Tax=Nicotiana tomentosiformis TaxID=4098 RepID=UPI00388C8AF2
MESSAFVQLSLFEHTNTRQYNVPHLPVFKDTVVRGCAKEVTIGDHCALRLQGRICVLNVDGLRELILEEAQSRQKIYADRKDCDIAFLESEKDLLRVFPMKYMIRFGKKGKLSPRYIGQFEILERVGEVDYRLAFPPSLPGVHTVFHVSMLRKFYKDLSHVLDFSSVQLDKNLAYEKEPMAILDKQVRKFRSKDIALVKDQWRGQPVEKVI